MLEIKKTGDADYPRHLNIALMGPPKSGKTTFLSTAPNILIGAAEAGLMSIAHKNVPYVDLDHSEKLAQLILVLGNDTLRKQLAAQVGLPDISTFSIDTADAWQNVLKKERMREMKRTQFQKDDWGWLKDTMAEQIKALCALPVNVIITVHTKTTQDDDGKIINMPGLQGGIAEELAGFVDFSVLAQRSAEIKPDGTPFTRYYLQVEGDLKNPHLGNRAAGRLPSEVEPDFQLLHDAVFKGIPTNVTASPVVQMDVPVAQTPGQAVAAAQPVPSPPAQVGAPPSDDDEPINLTALQHLGKFHEEFGLRINEEAMKTKPWTLGEARLVAKMFRAHKQDIAEGKAEMAAASAEMAALITEMGAPPLQDAPAAEAPKKAPAKKAAAKAAAEVPPVAPTAPGATPTIPPAPDVSVDPAPAPEPVAEQTPVQTPETPAPVAEATPEATPTPVEPLPSEPAPADTPPSEDAGPTDQEALKNLEAGGVTGQVLGVTFEPGSPCQKCGNAVDDEDIAQLSQTRFGEWLCVKDYIQRTKTPAA